MISIILGTRPEIIKMSPIIRACQQEKAPFFILHSGQHYSYEMDRAFFKDLHLPEPTYNLDVGSGSHAVQTARIMTGIEDVLHKENPDIVLVQGDTNTVLGGSLAASKIHTPVGHVEAGLRSFDRRMPEEINRIVSDHIADILFAPTRQAYNNLIHEGIHENSIFITGNTIVDAVRQNLVIAESATDILRQFDLRKNQYLLVTLHRTENVDNRTNLEEIIHGLILLEKHLCMPVVFPVHPRTRKMLESFGISTGNIHLINPLGFMEFLQLEAHARIVLTDSGGVQEETCILGVPCVTIRKNTERPETIDVGSNMLSGISSEKIVESAKKMESVHRDWKNPFGDGMTGKRIIDLILERYENVTTA